MKRHDFANRRPPSGLEPPRRLYGPHAVEAWLRHHPEQVQAVHYEAHPSTRVRALVRLAEVNGVVTRCGDAETLTRLAATRRHQGVVAELGAFPYCELAEVLTSSPRLLIAADQLQDPHNLGALLRTAAAVGIGAVVIPKDGAVGVTPAVEVAAAGAAAVVPVCRVTNLARTLRALRDEGYWIVGMSPRDGVDLYALDPPARIVVVLGGEDGMRPLVAKSCDLRVSIPMVGRAESLNASVAVAVMVYEVQRRWGSWAQLGRDA